MANELVIDFKGDNSDLDASFKKSMKNVNAFGDDVTDLEGDFNNAANSARGFSRKTARGFSTLGGKMKSSMKDAFSSMKKASSSSTSVMLGNLKAMLVVGVAKAFKSAFVGIGGFFVDALSAASTQEAAEAKLETVLKATGNAAGFSAEQLKELAKQLSDVTAIEDDVIINNLAIQATFKNIKGDVFIEAAKAAADMATVLDSDLKGATIQLSKALNDPIKGVSALGEAGVSFTAQQKEMIKSLVESGDIMSAQKIILSELNDEFGGAAKAAGDTFGGKMKKLKQRIGEMSESIGRKLIPIIENLLPKFEEWLRVIERTIPFVSKMISSIIAFEVSIFQKLQPVFEWLIGATLKTFTFVQTVIQNFGTAAKIVWVAFALDGVKSFNVLEHWFTVALPAHLDFFASNWKDIFGEMARFLGVVFTNIGVNLLNFFDLLSDLLSGRGVSFEWTALTDGFEKSFKKLPEIAKREMGPLEKELEEELMSLVSKFEGAFDKNLKANRKLLGLDGAAEGKDGIDLTPTDTGPTEFAGSSIRKKKKKPKEEAVSTAIVGLTALKSRIDAAGNKNPALEHAKKVDSEKIKLLKAIKKGVEKAMPEQEEKEKKPRPIRIPAVPRIREKFVVGEQSGNQSDASFAREESRRRSVFANKQLAETVRMRKSIEKEKKAGLR